MTINALGRPRSGPQERTRDWVFALLIAGFGVYAIVFIFRTSFLAGGERFFCLFDDAMISMRYAKNLAAGHGLTWNPGGEPIEGFTNPLWVGFMALLHLAPIGAAKISLGVQLGSAGCLLANLFVVRKTALTLTQGSRHAANCAVFLTASYFSLNNWSLQGMEVGAITLVLGWAVWLSTSRYETPWQVALPYLLLGAATWIRLDVLVLLLATLAVSVVADPSRRRQHLFFGLSACLLFVGVQCLLRYAYFGDLLPNTYYLKLTGFPAGWRLARGLFVLLQFLWQTNVALVLFALALFHVQRTRASALLACCIVSMACYSVYVGGDGWESMGGSNRFLSPVMPLGFILLVAGLNNWVQQRTRRPVVAGILLTSLLAGAAVGLNTTHGLRSLAQWTLLDRPPFVVSHRELVLRALKVRSVTRESAVVAVVRAGIMPYLMDRDTVDFLGKNDRVIARRPMRIPAGVPRFRAFWPGHLKWDYSYSIGELRPDLIASLWQIDRPSAALGLKEIPPDAREWIETDYRTVALDGTRFLARGDSPHILWERLESVPAP